MEKAYRNVGYVLLILLPIFVAGFWIPYLSEIPHFDQSITTAVHIHAVLLFGFLILLIVQPLAIRHRAFATHRALGKIANILIPLIVVFSIAMIWKEYHEHLAEGMSTQLARRAEFLSAAQLLLFGILYGAAVASIRNRDVGTHMRCMICIALVLLPAGLARMMGYWFNVRQSRAQTVCLIVIDAVLLGLIAYDWRHRFVRRSYVWVVAAYAVIEAAWISMGRPV